MGFDNFDFKDILNYAKPAAKAIGGVVKVAYGQGDGVNDVGDGLGGVLKAAGVDGDEGANPNEEQQSPSKPLDVFDMIPVKASPKAPQPNSAEQPKQAKPKSDRERVKELLLRRGWSEQEAEELLDGPKNKAEPGQRMKQQPGTRIAMSQSEMRQSTGVRLANREGRLIKGDEAQWLTAEDTEQEGS